MIGHPVAGVKLPQLFNARFMQLGIDARVDTLDVRPAQLKKLLAEFRADGGLAGIISTTPHKIALAAFADRLGATGARTGLANALRRGADGKIEGDMFDGHAFRRCLTDLAIPLAGLVVAIIGFGAAGRTCATEALHLGAAQIFVYDQDPAIMADAVKSGFARWDPGAGTAGRIDVLVNAASAPLAEDYVRRLCIAQEDRAFTVMDLVARDLTDEMLALSSCYDCRFIDGSGFAAAQFGAIWRFLVEQEAVDGALAPT